MMDSDSLLAFLQEDPGADINGVDADTPLVSSQLVDSFALVTLMMFLEKQTGIRIAPTDVNLDYMDAIARMLAYVERVALRAAASIWRPQNGSERRCIFMIWIS